MLVGERSPFALENVSAYRQWRINKLSMRPDSAEQLLVEVGDGANLTPAERAAILERVSACNIALYRSIEPLDKSGVIRLAEQLGLYSLDKNHCADGDKITAIRVVNDGSHRFYIPYTDRRLNWHTDGYYNPPQRRIRAMTLHCVQPAAQGGENELLDPEMVYMLMRDEDPRLVAALMARDAMTIPANDVEGGTLREAQSGPVFSIDGQTGALHMRYTARRRNIVWKNDGATRDAVEFLRDLCSGGNAPIYRCKLNAGEGILCNNVLHNRTGFSDDPEHPRLLYRGRYHQRIGSTSPPCLEVAG